jgi:hypothetical protein
MDRYSFVSSGYSVQGFQPFSMTKNCSMETGH